LEQIITIEIFGQPYSFKAKSEVTEAKEVADLLVKEVARVQDEQSGQSANLTKLAIMIIAALNIANENIELKRNYSKLVEEISDRSNRLIGELDDRMHGDTKEFQLHQDKSI